MVPGTGLEPARLATHAPQACVSTNFTTRAKNFSNIDNGALFGKGFLFEVKFEFISKILNALNDFGLCLELEL